MDELDLYNLIEMRKSILEQDSKKQQEIADKIDQLILNILNKKSTPET